MTPLVASSSVHDDILIFGTPEELLPVFDGILQSTSYKYSFIHSKEDITKYVKQHQPLLVLITYMPGSKGFESATNLKSDHATLHIPVIGIGMPNKRPSMTEVLEYGLDDFFILPDDAPAFYVRIGIYTALRQRIRSLEKTQNKFDPNTIISGKSDYQLTNGNVKFDYILENANANVYIVSTLGKLLYVSPNWNKVLGYMPGEHVGRQVVDVLVHPDDREVCLQAILKGVETKKLVSGVEYRMKHVDGSWRWMRSNIAPLIDSNGDFNSFIGIANDITENKSVETALYNSEKGYFGLFNSVTEAIYIMDENGFFLDVNRSVEKMYGYTREEIIGKTPDFLFAEDDAGFPYLMSCIREVFKSGDPKHFVVWGKRKNGEIFPKEVFCNKGKYFGKDVFVTTARDITERKKSEVALKESQEKFSKIFHLSPDVILLTRVSDGVIVDINDRAIALSGFSRDEIIGQTTLALEGWENDEDRNKYLNLLRQTGRVVNLEKKFKIKGGVVRYATISGEFIEIAGEKYILTVIHDITERKHIEFKLKEEALKLKLISDNLQDAVVFQVLLDFDGQMKFPYISNGVEKWLG
ncbi:MAG: PAS domain S-box protein [Chitinophagaceae bacterium]|nr:PAS domain S-box protein [Chitinophagaceae bacterium]